MEFFSFLKVCGGDEVVRGQRDLGLKPQSISRVSVRAKALTYLEASGTLKSYSRSSWANFSTSFFMP